ncbi:Myb-like DNA-binding domain containing protein [Trichomonas vaginalis G3]|uniref:Myb-like DNA-binding domain containing protein n=1 Tax=Trichomonas vaginalis (strain ATCC PRA-98 / G3) TaxID=412133 RepID=A2DFK8_TRIV3|nr:RNA polymerase II transcription regulator recruiting protein [Trichomonas vaginalis G3]EAY20711.1 Myb-like DNA-binding domain containing protein [Trichomonas vaginalis G3]KAI5528732.1 RNA polymerase II transcription regulator recruiting protein [Trichomonas vaginalis G3]|eukprot:XP_001581697.1 Myb-like DNA-binding domain containing protein [Trichomonas vaginalis G3]
MIKSNNLRCKNHFTYIEDRKLSDLINNFGCTDWNEIADKMPGRNARQCKERWEKYLSPTVNKGPYSYEEDQTILEQYEVYGSQWVKIASHLKGRSDASVKARFKLLMRRKNSTKRAKSREQFNKSEFNHFDQSDVPNEVYQDEKFDNSLRNQDSLSDDPSEYFTTYEVF